ATALVPADETEIVDVWQTAGLRGTGSNDVVIRSVVVPRERVVIGHMPARGELVWTSFGEPCQAKGPIQRLSPGFLASLGFAALALGVARATLSDFAELAAQKVAREEKSVLREGAVAQAVFGEAEARVRAGRALLMEVAAATWAKAEA